MNNSSKAVKITYWITTVLFSLLMAFSAFKYLTDEQMSAGFTHLGFPGYFRVELAIAKFVGVIVLLAPLPARLKEWAYAGFTIVLISAFLAHFNSGDPAANFMAPVIIGLVLATSYITFRKLPASQK